MEFEVSFSKSQRELSELLLLLEKAGEELDEMERIGVKTNNRYTRSLKATTAQINRTENSLSKMTSDTEQVGVAMEKVRKQTAKFFSDIASGNAKATYEIQALKSSTSELGQAIREQLANETYAKWLKKTATESANLRGENEHLRQSLDHLDNPHRRANLRLQAMKDHLDRVTVAGKKQELQNKELQQQLKLQGNELGLLNATLKERIRGVTQANTADERQRNQLAELVRQYGSLHGGIGEQIVQQKALNQARTQELTADTRLIAEVERLEKQVREYNTSLHAQKASLNETLRQKQELATRSQREEADLEKLSRKLRELNENGYARQRLELNQQIQVKEKLITENAREAASVEALERKLQEVMSFRGQYKAQLQEQIREQERKSTQNQREAATLEELRTKLAGLDGGYEKQRVQLQEAVRQKEALIRAEQREGQELEKLQQQLREMDSARGREIIQTREAIKAKRDEILETQKQAQAKERLERELKGLIDGEEREIAILKQRTQEQRRAVTEDERRQAAVRALRREMEYLQSAEGRAHIALKERVAAERNALQAQSRRHASMRVGNQLTASMRAGLAGLQSHIGMYTSSTIAAASATYAFSASIRDTVASGANFTESMSRAEAIMFSSADAAGTSADQMRALESQVRALGQSTVFTATEVSGGLIDLGMAGLSGGEALQALKPSLDLASIGMIEMSEAADIATNVMTAFKKDAGDLPDVVNVMATAVTNSNTNIQQLANSLSYVGPAAESAGFSMRDTVAAIELLASSGIKGSKAGTGLRRSMLNLLNPTTKGQKVLDKYNISVMNADGSTRSLTDIMGQFREAMYNDVITPAERSADIVDLVGVRAQSAFARMASSADELTVLREQLNNVAGAAERMREKIEDNLTADWKQVKSAFEEIELTVFENFEAQLRSLSAATTVWLQDLNEVVDTIGKFNQAAGFQVIDPSNPGGELIDVTKLDVIIARLEMAGEAAATLLATFAGWKVGTTLFTNLATGASDLNRGLTTLADKARAASVAQRSYADALALSNAHTAGQVSMMARLSSAAAASTAAVARLASAVNMAGKAGLFLSRAFGWVGLLWGAYEALQMTFGDEVSDKITDQKNRILEAEEAYKQYQETIKKTQHELNKGALEERLSTLTQNLSDLSEQIQEYEELRNRLLNEESLKGNEDAQAGIRSLEARLESLRRQAVDTQGEIRSVEEAIGDLGDTPASVRPLYEEYAELSGQIATVSGKLEEAREKSQGGGREAAVYASRIQRLEETLADLAGQLAITTSEIESQERATVSAIEQLDTLLRKRREDYREEVRVEGLTDQERLNELLQQERELRAEAISLTARYRLGSGDMGLDQFQRGYAKIEEQANDLRDAIEDQQDAVRANAETRDEAHERWLHQNRTEEQKITFLSGRMGDLNDKISEQNRLREEGSARYDAGVHAELLKERNQVQSEYNGLLQRGNEEQGRTTGYTQELEKQRKLLQEIGQSYSDYDSYVAQQRASLEVQRAKSELLYNENLSLEERARLHEVAFQAQKSLSDSLTRIHERSEQIAESEARVVALKEQAAGLTGKQRKDAEGAVNETLQQQKQLITDQLDDYRQLLDATISRTEELQSQIGGIEGERERIRLINEAAKAGKLITDQTADQIMAIRKQQQAYKDAVGQVEKLEESVKSATGEEKKRLQVVLSEAEERASKGRAYLDLLREGEYELSHQAEAIRAQAEAVEQFFSDTGDAIYDTLRDGFDDVDGMFDNIFDSFKDMLARMAYEAFINPIVVSVQQGVMGYMGLGGQGGGFGGIGSLVQGADNLLGTDIYGSVGNALGIGGSLGAAGTAATGYAGAGWASSVATGGYTGWAGSAAAGSAAGGGGFMSGLSAAAPWIGGGLVVDSLLGLGVVEGITDFVSDLFGGGKSEPSLHMRTVAPRDDYRGVFENTNHEVWGDSPFGTVGFWDPGTSRLNDLFGGDFDKARQMTEAIAAQDQMLAALAGSEQQLVAMTEAAREFEHWGGDSQSILDGLGDRTVAIVSAIDDEWAAFAEGLEGDNQAVMERIQQTAATLELLSSSAERLNLNLGETGELSLTAADSLAQMSGGAQNLASVQQGYYQAVYSETERLSHSQADLAAQLSSVTDTVPSTTDELRAMVEAQDLNTEAGREMALALMQLAPAFAQTTQAVEQAITEAYQQELDRAPDAAGLEYWMDEVVSGATTLEQALELIANSAEAAAESAGANLDDLLSQLGDASRTRRDQLRAELDATRGLHRSRIEGLRAEQSAVREAYQAASDAQRQALEKRRSDLETVRQAAEDAHTARMEGLSAEIDTVSQAIGVSEGVVSSLQGALDTLLGNQRDTQLPRYQQAITELTAMRGGNVDADRLDRLLGVVTADTRGLYTSFDAWDRQQGLTNNLLADLESEAAQQLSTDEMQLEALETQARRAERRHEALLEYYDDRFRAMDRQHEERMEALERERDTTLAGITDSIRQHEERIAQAQTQHDREVARLDAQLDYWEQQVQLAQGTYQATLGVGQAVNSLAAAVGSSAIAASAGSSSGSSVPGFAEGGIATGPMSGYPVELHGREAVIPLRGGDVPVDLRGGFDIGPLVDEIKELRRQVAKLEAYGYEQTKVQKKSYKIQDRWDRFGVPQGEEVNA